MKNNLMLLLLLLTIAKIHAVDKWESINVPPLVDEKYLSQDKNVKNKIEATIQLRKKLGLNYDVGVNAIDESLKWQNGISPRPILMADGVVRFPYGQYQPVVTCKPLNLCDIELQSGEEIQGILIGDSIRWNDADNGIPIVYSGDAKKLTPHLVLKPSQSGLETTLMVTTSKRTYMVKLRSASYGYVERAGFYYPHDEVVNYSLSAKQIKLKSMASTTNNAITNSQSKSGRLNYHYKVEDKSYSWRPTQVYDDGISVFIKMPDSISGKDLPSICIISDNDDTLCEMANFRYLDHYYVVDKLFTQAKLVVGFGDQAQAIMITSSSTPNQSRQEHFWSRVIGG